MASSNKTKNLKLNQFLGTDRVKMNDFNYDNQQLETLLSKACKNVELHDDTITFTRFDNTTIQIRIEASDAYGFLGDLINVKAQGGVNDITISWTTPNHNDFKGVKLIKKIGSYPTSTKDGEELINSTQKGNVSYVDSNVVKNTVYFYRLFAYNTDNVYNNDENAIVSTKLLDYTYNKSVVSISAKGDRYKVRINWTDPTDENWQGTKIIRKVGSAPIDITDGVLVVNSTQRNAFKDNEYVDANLTNDVNYYYKAFPYNQNNEYNNSMRNVTNAIPEFYTIYTVIIDENNSNSETAVTYADDAVSMIPGWENWKDKHIFKDIKPCTFNLKSKQVNYYLNRENRTLKENGEQAVLDGKDGDVVIEFPKRLGYKLERKGTNLHVSVSDYQHLDDTWSYAAFIDNDTNELCNKMHLGAYQVTEGYGSRSKRRLISGGYNRSNYWGAKLKEKHCMPWSFGAVTLLQCLYLIIYKDLNSRNALGNGRNIQIDTTTSYPTGETDNKPFCWGTPDRWKAIVFLGLESFYGDGDQFIGGIAFSNDNKIHFGYTDKVMERWQSKSGYMKTPVGNNYLGFINLDSDGGSSNTYYGSFNGLPDRNYSLCLTGSTYKNVYTSVFSMNGYPSFDFSSNTTRLMSLSN